MLAVTEYFEYTKNSGENVGAVSGLCGNPHNNL